MRKFIAGAVSAAILSTGLVLVVPVQSGAVSIVKYKNCAALNKKFPHGVGIPGARDKTSGKKVTNYYRSKALYLKNKSRDRDKDNIACEKR